MSSTQSPSPIAAPDSGIFTVELKALFANTAPADPPPAYSAVIDDAEAALAKTLRENPKEMRDALTKVFKSGAVDKMFTEKLEKLADTVARLQRDFDTVSVALVMFDGAKYEDPQTKQPIKEYRPDWLLLSGKYTELLTKARQFAGTIQFRATKYRTHVLPTLVNPKHTKAQRLQALDWFLKDTPEDIKAGGVHEDIQKDEKTALDLSQGFADLALAVKAFQAGLNLQIEKVAIALDDNIKNLQKKVDDIKIELDEYNRQKTGRIIGAGIGAALFGGGVALALCATGILAPIGIAVAVIGGLAALGFGGSAIYQHLKVIAEAEGRLLIAEQELHAAQEKQKKFVTVIKPALETANAAMDNIAQDLSAIASIFTHITNDAHQARLALESSMEDDIPDFLKNGVYELTSECYAKLDLALEAFASGCDKGLGAMA